MIPIETEADSALAYNSDYQKVFKQRKHTSRPHNIKWKPPDNSCVKVNFDGIMFDDVDEVGIGLLFATYMAKLWPPWLRRFRNPPQ